MSPPRRRRRVAAGVAIGALLAVGLLLSPRALLGRLGAALYSPWFPPLLVGLYLLRPLLAWPISALSVLVGYRYGLVVGFPVAMVGVVATSLIPYVAARRFRPEAGLAGRVSDVSERFFSATGDVRGVIAARLAPVPAEVISSAAGAGRVSVPAFVAGTLLGELPWTGAAVLLGDSMHRLSLSAASPDPGLIAVGLLAAALLLAGPAYRRLGSRRSDDA